MKLQCLKNSTNMDIWIVGTSDQLCIRGSWTETKFSKKQSSYSAKLHSLLKVHFALLAPFVLTLASDTAVLYISKHYIFNLSTFSWKTLLQLFENDFRFYDFFFKVKVFETFKILWLSHKHANLSSEWLFWK